ncbi:polyadenylate-binding protein-interacting protein 1 isoform X2 [Boleophthalmus pectinirostris]|uniref:polyadenylate-binding protein-interacting protein 1 isoform X2 n=1 Tax=Boleophthalmus pectinirostris TaxID=150288 RepID=UPI002432BF8F|nr:polyadenylate-binding protein-interacting protein 1 isoform X2 [Boleophthalmus pectinirostris]
MNDPFDRAPGAGRSRVNPGEYGFPVGASAAEEEAKSPIFIQREPLRQPRTCPPPPESTSSPNSGADTGSDWNCPKKTQQYPQSTPVYNEETPLYDEGDAYYNEPTLADMVTDFLGHLSSSPGSFETDIEYITNMLSSYVSTEELLQELVELIYSKSTEIPNFSYMGARLCNYLSHHLTISTAKGNFRQLLLIRCQTEYEQRDKAVWGDAETQKRFHSYVLFLAELYLHLEVKGAKGTERAQILLTALKDLMISLLSNPVDANLICAVKLLKLTGSVLDDEWKSRRQTHMDEIIQRIETVLLDATCSRDVRQMLLKLVELRSSDWGRVKSATVASSATPDNDPNYFMNEPIFYTEDGTPFTAADPDFAERYQEIMDKQNYFHDLDGENGSEGFDFEDEMEPEIEEAFESFCLETERKHQNRGSQ